MTAGSRAIQHSAVEYIGIYERSVCGKITMYIFSCLFVLCFFPFSLLWCIVVVNEYERLILNRIGSGKVNQVGPGFFFVLPFVRTYKKLDLRMYAETLPFQQVMTKDGVELSANVALFYRCDYVGHFNDTKTLAQLMAKHFLYATVGRHNLMDLVVNRAHIEKDVTSQINERAEETQLGVWVEKFSINGLHLTEEMKWNLAVEAVSARQAKAEVILSRGEHEAALLMKGASRYIEDSPVAMQLQYLHHLQISASENTHSVVFPLPIELMSALIQSGKKIFRQS